MFLVLVTIALMFITALIIMLITSMPSPKSDEEYIRENNEEIDRLINEIMYKQFKPNRHLTLIKKEDEKDGQKDSKTNN